MRIGQKVLNLLETQKKSQKELALYLGVGTSTVNGWRQENRNPSSELIVPLCKFFNISTDYLLKENDVANNTTNDKENGEMENKINQEILEAGVRKILNACKKQIGHPEKSIDFCMALAKVLNASLKEAKDFRDFKNPLTYEKVQKAVQYYRLTEDKDCVLLLQELADHDIFDETEKDKFNDILIRLQRLERIVLEQKISDSKFEEDRDIV